MFKQLDSEDVSVREYQAQKRWQLTESAPDITFHAGANIDEFGKDGPKNNSGTGVREVYELIRHMYYREDGNAYDRFGAFDLSQIDLSTFPTEDRAIIYVLKISSRLFGKRIAPGSVEITTEDDNRSLTAVDDGRGNLFVKGQNTLLGNIFYPTGTLVLTQRPDNIFQLPNYVMWPNYTFEDIVFEQSETSTTFPDYELDVYDMLFKQFDIEFQSVVSNYENAISTEATPSRFSATTNPTARTEEDEAIKPLEDGDFRPYVTNVGLYNDEFELIATGKLSRPIKLSDTTPITFRTKYDT